eukprot:scaffold569_cov165-Amphora_coffeaeformis.AAC.20
MASLVHMEVARVCMHRCFCTTRAAKRPTRPQPAPISKIRHALDKMDGLETNHLDKTTADGHMTVTNNV